MDLDEYIDRLRAKNKNCKCLDLQGLYVLRSVGEGMCGKYNQMKVNLPLSIESEDDEEFLKIFEEIKEETRILSDQYYRTLGFGLKNGRLVFALQSLENENGARVSYPMAFALAKRRMGILPIFGVRCGPCDTQVDVAYL